jgi:TonB family protein
LSCDRFGAQDVFGGTHLSIVFDARKHAEQSKRAREAVAETEPSKNSGPILSNLEDATLSNQESAHAPNSQYPPDTLSASSDVSSATLLALRVERRTNDWRLRWNRDAAANATQGRLTITDGAIHKQLDLDANELRNGSIVYTPKTDDVVLRLEMESAGSGTPLVESVRLVGGAAPPLQQQKETKHASSTERGGSARIARSDAAWAGSAARTEGAAGKLAPLVRSLLRTPRAAPVDEEPQAANPVERGGKIEPATLVLRVDPAYPASAKESFISGTVELRFRISPEGKVYDVRSVRGAPILARAAIQAVEGWCYEPARLNGAPIDSQASTNFDFELN